MGYRLSKITTRTGDGGETGLGDGTRVAKDDARIDALGSVDELNSHLGALLVHALPEDLSACLTQVQNDLFALGGEYLLLHTSGFTPVAGVLSFVMFMAVCVLEMLVMALQAYVFVLLTSMYIAGALADEH